MTSCELARARSALMVFVGLSCGSACYRSNEHPAPRPAAPISRQGTKVDATLDHAPCECARPSPELPQVRPEMERTLPRIEPDWHEWIHDAWDSSVQLAELEDREMFVFDQACLARSTEEGFKNEGLREGLPSPIAGFWPSALGGRWPEDAYLGLSHTMDVPDEHAGAQLYRWDSRSARWKLVHGNTQGLYHYIGISYWKNAPHRMVGVLGGGYMPNQTIVTVPSRVSSPFEVPRSDSEDPISLMRPSAISVVGDRLFVTGWSDEFASGFVEIYSLGKSRAQLHFVSRDEREFLHLDALDAVTEDDAWVGGWSKDCSNEEKARLFHYTGSRWWAEVEVPLDGRITSLEAQPDGTLWVVLDERLLRRDTNGMWTELSTPLEFGAREVIVWSEDDLWLAGRRGVLRTRPVERVLNWDTTCFQIPIDTAQGGDD